MSKIRVICLGEILFDCIADQVGLPYERVQSWTPYPGGAPANVATALVKLGTPAAFVGAVGQDPAGDELVQLLQSIGVDTGGVQRNQHPTRKVYVVRSPEGDREFAGFGEQAVDSFADAYLDKTGLPQSLFTQAEYLVIGTLELAYPQTREAIFQALDWAKQSGVKVMLDVNLRPMFWPDQQQAFPLIRQLWPYVDLVKLSDDEAELLFDTADAGAIANQLDTVDGVLVTAGDRPISYCLAEHQGVMQSFRVQVQETTGAGDAFTAGLLHQLLKLDLNQLNPKQAEQIVRWAAAVGALTTTSPGAIAAQPTPAAVQSFLQSHT